MEVLPGWAPSKWLRVFSQQWEGDVTIVLPHTFLQLYKAVVNPSNAGGLALRRSCLNGLPRCGAFNSRRPGYSCFWWHPGTAWGR